MSSKSFIKSSNNQTSIFKVNKEIRMLENSELKNVMLSVVLVQEAKGEEVSRDNLDSRINDALVKNFGMSAKDVVFFKLNGYVMPDTKEGKAISTEELEKLPLNVAADLVAEKKAGLEAIIEEQTQRVILNIMEQVCNPEKTEDELQKIKVSKCAYDASRTQTLFMHYKLLDNLVDKDVLLEKIATKFAKGIKNIHDNNINTIKKLGLE